MDRISFVIYYFVFKIKINEVYENVEIILNVLFLSIV